MIVPRLLWISLAAVLLVTATPAAAAIVAEDYEVSFGTFAKSPSGTDVIVPSTTFPLRFEASGFRWGFIVRNRKGASFVGHVILHLPKPPATISGGLSEGDVKGGGNIIVSKPRSHQGVWSSSYWFEPGDPLGAWRIELYIDNHLLKTFDVTVVPER